MCLYPKLIRNPKYKPTKKNGGKPPVCYDTRLLYIPAACGECYECRKKKQREYQIRLQEEIRHTHGEFLTLTIDNDWYKKLEKKIPKLPKETIKETKINGEYDNLIATVALRKFLERCRKETGKSIKHWCITELGEENGRIHIHGIFFGKDINKTIQKNWEYGFIYIGQYVNERTVMYITKYMFKQCEYNKLFKGKVLSSSGIGSGYVSRFDSSRNKYKDNGNTNETYQFRNGVKVNLPNYYRDKIYSEEEKEKLWIEKLEKGYIWIMGEKVNAKNPEEFSKCLEYYQARAIKLGGAKKEDWEKSKYIRRLIRENRRR